MNIECRHPQERVDILKSHLSEATPVVDLLHLRPFLLDVVKTAASGPQGITTLWILGTVSAGKEVLIEQFLWLLENDREFKKPIKELKDKTGKDLEIEYLSTPMCNWSATERGKIKSRIGDYTPNDVKAHNKEMNRYLEESEAEGGPKLRIVETPVHGYPRWNFGVDPLFRSLRNAKYNPHRKEKAIYLFPSSELQDHGIEVREIIEFSHQDEEAELYVKEENVSFDEHIHRDELVRAWGNRKTRHQNDQAGELNLRLESTIIHRRLAEMGIEFPEYLVVRTPDVDDIRRRMSFGEFAGDSRLRTKAFLQRAIYLMRFVFRIPPEDFAIRLNHLIPKESGIVVPYYRSLAKKYGLVVIVDEEYKRRLRGSMMKEIAEKRNALQESRSKLPEEVRDRLMRELARHAHKKRKTKKARSVFHR